MNRYSSAWSMFLNSRVSTVLTAEQKLTHVGRVSRRGQAFDKAEVPLPPFSFKLI